MRATWRRRHARLARLRVQAGALAARAGVTFTRTAATVAAIPMIAEHLITAGRAAAQRAGVAVAAAATDAALEHVLALRRLVDVRIAAVTAAAAYLLLTTVIALTAALLAALRTQRIVAVARVRRLAVRVMLMRVHMGAVLVLMRVCVIMRVCVRV